MRPSVKSGFLISALIAASPAIAGWDCSVDQAFPEVAKLDVVDGKLIATLGIFYGPEGKVGRGSLRNRRRIETLDGKNWQVSDEPVEDNFTVEVDCMDVPKDREGAWRALNGKENSLPPKDSGSTFFSQFVTSCAPTESPQWAGIGYYGAEGGWGAGGIAYKDADTGYTEILRLRQIGTSNSVSKLAYFADKLWFGTTQYSEGCSRIPGSGLKRLDVKFDLHKIKSHRVREIPDVCGFTILDFTEFDGALWVASELGLARLQDKDEPVWTNYVPDLESSELMRETSCEKLYEELLRSKHVANSAAFDVGNAFDIFWRRLSKHRPLFMQAYMRRIHGYSDENYPISED